MKILLLLPLSLLHGAAWAACIPNWTPSVESVGTLQVLKYNDLSPENNGTAAVLAHKKQTNPKAQSTCATIGENLFEIPETPNSNLTELQYQLDYLVFNKDLPPDGFLWVKPQGSGTGCLAYAYSRKTVTRVSCDAEFPVLCTSSPPPTTEENGEVEKYSKISVEAGDYSLTGYRDGRSFRFLGIPFADPPVGNLRLMPPRPYSGPRDVEATSFGKNCMQGSRANPKEFSEDCLYVNVYTPVIPESDSCTVGRRPVALYLYGGAFVSGSSSSPRYEGGNFASRNDVIVVTFNYRLGALGFLATDSLLSGSQGIKDQVLALQWVNKHIASFGGDPSRVTIFGQSAGGQSVIALLSSSATQGLFAGAISQSSPIGLPWFTREVYTEFITPQVSSDVGCNETTSEKDLVSCLQSAPAAEFLQVDVSELSSSVNKGYLHTSVLVAGIEPYLPMIDDTESGVIDDQFHILLEEDKLPNRVPTMFTAVSDEAAAWLNIVPELGSDQESLDAALSIAYPNDLAEEMVDSGDFLVNSSNPDGVRVAIASFLTNSEWLCPQAHLMNRANNSFPMLYEGLITRGYASNSSFTTEICIPNDNYNATCHASDVVPVWGAINVLDEDSYYDEDGLPHSQLMNDIWGSFFRTHDPNPDVNMLKIRGPAYASTYHAFAEQGYELRQFNASTGDVNKLGLPPSHTDGPLFPQQCEVFESYGYTFERAKIET